MLQQQCNKVGKVETGSVALPAIMRSGAGGPESFQMGSMPQAKQHITSGQMHRGHMPPLVGVERRQTVPEKVLLVPPSLSDSRLPGLMGVAMKAAVFICEPVWMIRLGLRAAAVLRKVNSPERLQLQGRSCCWNENELQPQADACRGAERGMNPCACCFRRHQPSRR